MRLVLLLILIVVVAAPLLGRWMRRTPSALVARRIRQVLIWLAVAVLLVLAATGHLNWLTAAIGGLLALIARALPLLLRYLPLAERLWRQQQGSPRTPNVTDKMTHEKALEILGLESGASKEQIVDAHRRLIQKLHPDRGGSSYLAARINKAKDILIG